MKKIVILGLILSLLTGCLRKQETPPQAFTIHLFTSDTCSYCKQLKEELIPLIEEKYQGFVSINDYNIDTKEHLELYDSYVGLYNPDTKVWDLEGKLKGVDKDSASYKRYVPLFVLEGYYGFIGYTEGIEDQYLEDMARAFAHQKLTQGPCAIGRFEFR